MTTNKSESIDDEFLDDETEYVEVIPEPQPIKELEPIEYKREDIRGKLAFAYVIGFFVILVISIVVASLNEGDKLNATKEILLTVSGILSGPLGFVIGYYFRSQE